MKTKLFFIFTFYVLLFTFYVIPVHAQHFTSSNYIIDFGNFNMTSGRKSSTNYSLTDTVGQNSPGKYDSSGFIVKAGFQYIYDTFNQFSFSIDNLNIALGTLVPGIGVTATNTIAISSPSGHGYQIMVSQNHPLVQSAGITIPDTTCDSGLCDVTTSSPWTSSSVYGFGFNAIGVNSSGVTTNIGTSGYFTNNTYYRPFSTNPISQILMSETVGTHNPNPIHYARVSYKANISSIQSAGEYQNSIIFIAVPKY